MIKGLNLFINPESRKNLLKWLSRCLVNKYTTQQASFETLDNAKTRLTNPESYPEKGVTVHIITHFYANLELKDASLILSRSVVRHY